MKIHLKFPYQFYLATHIVALDMDFTETGLSYRKVLEIIAGSFDSPIRQLIVADDHKIAAIIIVNNKCLNPDDPVGDGDQITLMMPLEGG